MARLVVVDSDPPRERALGDFPCHVGRLAACELQLDEPQSSRKHFRIERRDAGWFVVDLGSRNGTLLNGERVAGEAPLRHGDRLRVGETEVAFESAPAPLPEGRRLGGVVLGRVLGRTAWGTRYAGRQDALDREVEVEVLDPTIALDPAARRRHEERARRAGALEHPAIQGVYDTSEDGAHVFVVREAVGGRHLEERLVHGPAFDREAALGLIRDLAQALAHVHARGEAHGCLTGACVLVAPGGRAKLTGLGEEPGARLRKHRQDAALQALYAAPEQVRGEPGGAPADVYALGVIAHRLLLGAPPYEDGKPAELLARHAAPAPVALPASLDPELARLLAGLLEKDPARRLAAAAVERALLEQGGGSKRARRGTSDRLGAERLATSSARTEPPGRRAGSARAEPARPEPGRPEPGPRPASARLPAGASESARRTAAAGAGGGLDVLPVRLALLAFGYVAVTVAAALATRVVLRLLAA